MVSIRDIEEVLEFLASESGNSYTIEKQYTSYQIFENGIVFSPLLKKSDLDLWIRAYVRGYMKGKEK